ncbi:MAG: DUF6259 domain-containing protein [Verrucomicrobia bacterium]|nr:DUF6259 domain-containing protein [Verrucomicrobiota bacterium]
MKTMQKLVAVVLLLLPVSVLAASAGRWDFENNATGWREPAGGGIITEPGAPANHAYQIIATQPHHTHLRLNGSEASPDFVASARFKVLSFEGEAPVIYFYGRLTTGFVAVSVAQNKASGMAYSGQNGHNPHFGGPAIAAGDGWINVKFACWKDRFYAKLWPQDGREPRWQIHGETTSHDKGGFALGVWTSPWKPSSARVLFDDIAFQPLTDQDAPVLQLGAVKRPALDPARVSPKDGVFEATGDVGLATASMLVAFDRASGELTHIVHHKSGQEFVSPRESRPLFAVTLTKPRQGKKHELTADDFRTVTATNTGAGKLELDFSGHRSLPLTVRVTATTGADGFVRLRMAVANKSDWAVARIAFPQFAAPAALGGDAADDRLLLPLSHSDGSVIEGPGLLSQTREAMYPESAFTQFAALYDSKAGLYLATHDPDGHCKELGVRSVKNQFVEIPLAHLLPEQPGRDVSLPYEVVLGAFNGDWRDAANIYKQWAKRQPWCAMPLAQRRDIPQFLKEGAGIIIAGIQNPKGYNGCFGDNLERLPQLMSDYRKRTGLAHMVFVPYGWENRGTWAGIHYLPAVPSNEAWEKANAALRAQGDRVAMLTSGFWWVVKRKETSNGPAFDDSADFERRKEMVIRNADSSVFTADFYDRTQEQASWRGLSVKLCHGSAEARKTMLEIFLNTARLGTPLVSFDQEIGGGQHQPCYSDTHGHPPGYGNWTWTSFRDLCADILRRGKPIQPEMGLLMENVSELAIPYMATYWSRQFGEVDHGATGARGVGLFSYLYHEYVTAIGAACVQGQGPLGVRGSAELRCHVLANNLTRGLIPGPFIQDVPLEPTNDKWKAPVAEAYFSFCKPYARFPEYLLLGETRRPPQVECADHEVWFYRQDSRGQSLKSGGPKVVKATLRLPVVTAGSFAAADGSVGTVIVNATSQAQTATVRLNDSIKHATLFRADRTEEKRWERSSDKIEVTLEPFGTRCLVIR